MLDISKDTSNILRWEFIKENKKIRKKRKKPRNQPNNDQEKKRLFFLFFLTVIVYFVFSWLLSLSRACFPSLFLFFLVAFFYKFPPQPIKQHVGSLKRKKTLQQSDTSTSSSFLYIRRSLFSLLISSFSTFTHFLCPIFLWYNYFLSYCPLLFFLIRSY